MSTITTNQLDLLHHTLGLRPDQREPYRNHFVAGAGHHDQPDLEKLEAAGLMMRGRAPKFLDAGDVVFHATEAGYAFAIKHLPKPQPALKQSRYQEYLDADTGHSFVEFLGINPPVVEWNRRWGKDAQWRYVRRDWRCRTDVSGEWRSTKKEAKASYKAALSTHRAMQKGCAQ